MYKRQGQERAPLWEALRAHVAAGYTGFHVPGHKGKHMPGELSAAWGRDVFAYDLTELPGLDNLHAVSYTHLDVYKRQ